MKDFLSRNKAFLGIVIATILLLFGGIYLFSRSGKTTTNEPTVDSTLLIPADAYKFTSTSTPLTLVEFGDYQCPACGAYHPVVKQLLTDYSGKLNFVFRNFPLSQHQNGLISSYAAEAAGLQGKFWEMHNKIYETQASWSTSTDTKTLFIGYAKDLGLDVGKFTADIDSKLIKDKVQSDVTDGNKIGINATPTFYLNGKKISLAGSYNDFKKIIDSAFQGTTESASGASDAYHAHFDLKVYINGSPIDLSLSKYQSTEGAELDPYIHLHDGNGEVVHVHKENIPLSELFSSIKLNFPSDTSTNNLKVYVNSTKSSEGLAYIPKDLDHVLVSYGSTEDGSLAKQINSVSDNACIYSLTCPEKGTPPPESCAGGLGTGCED